MTWRCDTCRSVHMTGLTLPHQVAAVLLPHLAQAAALAVHPALAAVAAGAAATMSHLESTAVHKKKLGVTAASLG